MPDRYPLPLGRAAVALARHRSGGSAKSASRSVKSDGRPAGIARGRHRSSPTARRESSDGGSVKSEPAVPITKKGSELRSPRSAAADVSTVKKAFLMAAGDAGDDDTHATDETERTNETQATDDSQSQLTNVAVVPTPPETDGELQAEAADSEAMSETSRKKSKKKFWLKSKLGSKPAKSPAGKDVEPELKKEEEKITMSPIIASGDDDAHRASEKQAAVDGPEGSTTGIGNEEQSTAADSKASESVVSAATPASGRTKKKKSWLKPPLGPRRNAAEDAARPEKEPESESHAEDESVSKLSTSSENEFNKVATGIENEKCLSTTDSRVSEEEVSVATSASGKIWKKKSWLKPSLGPKKNIANDAARTEKASKSDIKSKLKLSDDENVEPPKKAAEDETKKVDQHHGKATSESGEEIEGQKAEEKRSESKPAPGKDVWSLRNEAAEQIKEVDVSSDTRSKSVEVTNNNDTSCAGDCKLPLKKKAAVENMCVAGVPSGDAASECSGRKKKKKLGLNLSSFSKVLPKSNISMPNLGGKDQVISKEESEASKCKEGATKLVVADEGEAAPAADSVVPTIKATDSSRSTADVNLEEDLLKICMSHSTLSIMTNDTAYTEYVNTANSRNAESASNAKKQDTKMTNGTEDVAMAEVDLQRVITKLSDERAGDQGIEWLMDHFEEEVAGHEVSMEVLRRRIDEGGARKREEEELLQRQRRREEINSKQEWKGMTSGIEEVAMTEVNIEQVSTRLSDKRAGDQGMEWPLEHFEEGAKVSKMSPEKLHLKIEEEEIKKREEELLDRERRRQETSVASASLPPDEIQTNAGCGLRTLFGFFEGNEEAGVRDKEAGASILSIFGCPKGNEAEVRNKDAEDTLSIASGEAQFVLDQFSDDKPDPSLAWSGSLHEEIKEVADSLNVIDMEKSRSGKSMESIKRHLSGLEALPPDAPEEVRESYYRALSQAAVLNARMESRRAELELRRIELESMRVEEQMECMMDGDGSDDELDDDTATDLDTLDDTVATEASAESFFSALSRMFMPDGRDGRSVAEHVAGSTEPKAPMPILKW